MVSITETPEPPQSELQPAKLRFASVLGAILRVFGRTWRGLVLADVLFKVFGALLTLGLMSAVLSAVMAETGSSAVTNTDIVAFLVHPKGLLLAFAGGAGTLFLILLEQAVLMAVAAILFYRSQLKPRDITKASGAAAYRIFRLAALLVLISLVIAVLPLSTGVLLFISVLGAHDINYYLSTRPPEFLVIAGVTTTLILGAVALLASLYVRAVLALPILLFEQHSPVRSIRESFSRTQKAGWRVAALLLAWNGAWSLTSWVCLAGFRSLVGFGIHAADTTAAAVFSAATVLVGFSLMVAALSFGSLAGHALLILKLYMSLHPKETRPDPAPDPPGTLEKESSLARRALLAGALLLAMILAVSVGLVTRLSQIGHTEITAHRGYSKVAPENTLSAIRMAIEAGADWAEIDVQETSDGVVVVTHDRDLMRMARNPRRVTDTPFEELRAIDVGITFSPRFAGERVPSLEEVISLAHGKIKLNIELKYYGDDPRLVKDVAHILRKNNFEQECFVASLNYPKLLEIKRENPALKTGAIITVGLGEITRLDVDVLSVNASLVNFLFLRKARKAGKEVHVWTVDDSGAAKVLMGRGIANLITNDPVRLLQARRAWEEFSPAKKLLLTSCSLLGLSEERGMDEVTSQGEL
jgi:glycerophosphoryl diester phosphodiesterase